jgi:hypothetical protein
MAYTLELFCEDARAALGEDPGPQGRQKLTEKLEFLLGDDSFIAAHLGPDKPSRAEIIYKDPDFGFQVMAHTNRGSSNNSPHCHGPSWVVYGIAMNHVEMTKWSRRDDGSRDGHAELEISDRYVLEEGQARVYNEGVIHSLNRQLETRLIRVTGCDLDKVLRYRYDPEDDGVKTLMPDDR